MDILSGSLFDGADWGKQEPLKFRGILTTTNAFALAALRFSQSPMKNVYHNEDPYPGNPHGHYLYSITLRNPIVVQVEIVSNVKFGYFGQENVMTLKSVLLPVCH